MAKVLTQFSSHANTIADTFRAAFVKVQLGDCTIDMTAPDESTKGGLLGLQHAVLRMESGQTIVVGTVHAGEKKAELRSFTLVSKVYEDRFKKPVPFAEPQYTAFLEKAEPVLAAFGLAVTRIYTLPVPPKPERNPAAIDSIPPGAEWTPWRIATWVAFFIGLIGIVAGGVYWARRK